MNRLQKFKESMPVTRLEWVSCLLGLAASGLVVSALLVFGTGLVIRTISFAREKWGGAASAITNRTDAASEYYRGLIDYCQTEAQVNHGVPPAQSYDKCYSVAIGAMEHGWREAPTEGYHWPPTDNEIKRHDQDTANGGR